MARGFENFTKAFTEYQRTLQMLGDMVRAQTYSRNPMRRFTAATANEMVPMPQGNVPSMADYYAAADTTEHPALGMMPMAPGSAPLFSRGNSMNYRWPPSLASQYDGVMVPKHTAERMIRAHGRVPDSFFGEVGNASRYSAGQVLRWLGFGEDW